MATTDEMVQDFLSQKRIAVAGVSRSGKDAANAIYDKLKMTGHEVFAINPKAATIAGDPCYPDIAAIPGSVDGVVTVTTPEVTAQIVQQCVTAGVRRVWMHRSLGSSVSESAVQLCHQHGIKVIAGGCPMMFQEPVDLGHKCLRWWFRVTGSLPK
jgi:predicted CoA-binding protein